MRHRFFATALVDEYYRVWHVWVTAVCDKETAREYLADIRLGPNSYRSTAPPGSLDLFDKKWSNFMLYQEGNSAKVFVCTM